MIRNNIVAVIFFIAWFTFSCESKKKENTSNEQPETSETVQYNNPVLPGDYADPSVVRVENDYWGTATSSEWAPLFPILHSTNLVDWEIVGHVFPEKLPDWAEAHFWAPEISYDNGTYYIYYTAKKKGGNLCVGVASATDPKGPYKDHGPLVCQEVGSIDGFPIRDEKGDLFLIWKEDGNSRGLPTPMWGQRMNEERTQLIGEKFELFRNDPNTWEGGLVEGAFLIRKGDYYYAFYSGDACCGRGCTYGVGVARAKNLQGPWEKHQNNPIMKQNETWKCAGHGSLVTDTNGRYYFLYHAYSTDGSVYTGREGLLDEVYWGEDQWPYFNESAPSASAAAPYNENEPDTLDFIYEFNASGLPSTWQWPVDNKPEYTIADGSLKVKASPDKIGTILGQRTNAANYTASTAVDIKTLPQGVMAGLSAIGDPENATGIAVNNGEVVLYTAKGKDINTIVKIKPAVDSGFIQLRVDVTEGYKMSFSWSEDGEEWQPLNPQEAIDASYLPPWDRAVRIGLTVKGPASSIASFDWFRYNAN